MKKTAHFLFVITIIGLIYSSNLTNEQYYSQHYSVQYGIDLVDLTKQATTTNRQYKRNEAPKYLMIHQTDTRQALGYKSWLKIKSHLAASHDNRLLLLHPLDYKIKGTLGGFVSLEVSGRFACLIYPNFDKSHIDKLTDNQKENIKDAIDYFINYSISRDLSISQLYLVAHSQTFNLRECDPGVEIYKFASEYALLRGMNVDYNWFIDSGKPINKLWRN